MFDRITTLVIAVGLAFLVWLYIRSRDQEVYERNVPVVFKVSGQQADMFQIMGDEKIEVPVSFTGPPLCIRELQGMWGRGEISLVRFITVSEADLQKGRVIYEDTLEARQLNVPPGVRVDIPPSRRKNTILLRRLIKKTMKVQVRYLGDQERVQNAQVQPAEVEVHGPLELLAQADTVATEYFRLPDSESDKEEPIKDKSLLVLKRLNDTPIEVSPPAVNLTFTLKPSQRTHEVQEVQVHFLQPAGFPFRAEFIHQRGGIIKLLVKGPAHPPTGIYAFVDLTKKQYTAGLQSEEPITTFLPPGYELAQKPPRLAQFNLVPLDAPSKPPG